uniref:Uncharacterized protein n=1 Tax=Arundo donax TaxID=35708 RepID=A0A0A8Y0I4_ARUDO
MGGADVPAGGSRRLVDQEQRVGDIADVNDVPELVPHRVRASFQEVDEELAACVILRLQQGTEHQRGIDSHHIEPGLPPIFKRRLF